MSEEEINKLLKDNPIKIIKFDDIEVPVEWLKQTTVNINGDDYIKLQQENKLLKEVIDKAVDIAYEYGQIDGNHHKLWVIDQMLRALLNENYQDFIKDYEEDGKYTWDTGIAP